MLNFKELYLNLKKKHNLGFYIRIDSGKPVLVVDYDMKTIVTGKQKYIKMNEEEFRKEIGK